MKYRKLRGKIKEVFGTLKAFAEAMDMDTASISMRLSDRIAWKREEIEKSCKVLHIPIEEVYLYFF